MAAHEGLNKHDLVEIRQAPRKTDVDRGDFGYGASLGVTGLCPS